MHSAHHQTQGVKIGARCPEKINIILIYCMAISHIFVLTPKTPHPASAFRNIFSLWRIFYGEFLKSIGKQTRTIFRKIKVLDKKEWDIVKIINELRRQKILTLHNSFSGWNSFVNEYIVKFIRETIERQTLLAKQRLSFMKYYSNIYNDFDLPRLICDQMDSRLNINKVDEL